MRVQELMQKDVRVCRADAAMTEAARIMSEADRGSVPVVEGGRLSGIITDRDVCMAAYTRGRPLAELPVADAMSRDVRTCGLRTSSPPPRGRCARRRSAGCLSWTARASCSEAGEVRHPR